MQKTTFAAILAVFTLCSACVHSQAADVENDSETTKETDVVCIDDCAPEDWYASAVRYSVGRDLMDCSSTLTGETIFRPDVAIKREEVADTIYRTVKMVSTGLAEKYGGNEADKLDDFQRTDARMRDGVRFCFDSGIMNGDADGLLHPLDSVKREEYAAVLARFITLLVENDLINDVVEADGMAVQEYTDAEQISDWAKEPVGICLKNGLMKGRTDGSFDPKGTVSRAQMAQVLYNLAPAGAK